MEVTSKVKLIGLLAWFAGMALAGAAAAQEPLKIGAINPYSGPLALYGDEMARGYQIAVNERNASTDNVLGGVRSALILFAEHIDVLKGRVADQETNDELYRKLVGVQVAIETRFCSSRASRIQISFGQSLQLFSVASSVTSISPRSNSGTTVCMKPE